MKPEPVTKKVVCSVCGIDWARHVPDGAKDEDVTLETCVRLMKTDMAQMVGARPFYSNGVTAFPQTFTWGASNLRPQ